MTTYLDGSGGGYQDQMAPDSTSFYSPSSHPAAAELQYLEPPPTPMANTILIPPDSIVTPCSAVSTPLTLPSTSQDQHLTNLTTTTMSSLQQCNTSVVSNHHQQQLAGFHTESQMVTSYILEPPPPLIPDEAAAQATRQQIDLGQIVRQTIETPSEGVTVNVPQQHYAVQTHPNMEIAQGEVVQQDYSQFQTATAVHSISTASAEAAQAAVAAALIGTEGDPHQQQQQAASAPAVVSIAAPNTAGTVDNSVVQPVQMYTAAPVIEAGQHIQAVAGQQQEVVVTSSQHQAQSETPERVVVEEAKSVNIESTATASIEMSGVDLMTTHHVHQVDNVASTVTVVSSDPPATEPQAEVVDSSPTQKETEGRENATTAPSGGEEKTGDDKSKAQEINFSMF